MSSSVHHYVTRWYQKRFLPPGQNKLCYLNLKPEVVEKNGHPFTRRAVRYWEPARCFYEDDLYSMRFGKRTSDLMETYLFGRIDKEGAKAAHIFGNYSDYSDNVYHAFRPMMQFLGAQQFRTPHGLDWIKRHVGSADHNQTLIYMSNLLDAYATMWAEGIWEIVFARKSSVKFIISDDPVTFFNRRIFPGEDAYPGGDDFPKIGTRTIFPLSGEACLIVTHLQLVRDPWRKPLDLRVNARSFADTMFDLTSIQFGRELEEGEVLRINYILKKRATRFIAAAAEETLYPEKALGNPNWPKLDDDWFLFPNLWKVTFRGGIRAGYKDGTTFAMDEYGRNPGHRSFEDKKQQNLEFRKFENAKREWAKRRAGKSLARVIDLRNNDFYDRYMQEYLEEQGLMAKQPSSAKDQSESASS